VSRAASLLALLLCLAADAPASAAEIDASTGVITVGGRTAHSLALQTPGGWVAAPRVAGVEREGAVVRARFLTADGGRAIDVEVAPDGDGAERLAARAGGASAVRIGFDAAADERYLGFGERSNAVDQRGGVVESYVGEGTYQPEERQIITAFVPAWSIRWRDDATYFPMPWLLSTAGYGVLVDNAETSRFDLTGRTTYTAEVEAPALYLRVLTGPTPADVVRRLTERTGRQPAPGAAWFYGPWFQTGQPNQVPQEQEYVKLLRDADAPVSAAETHMRYLPCGAHTTKRDAEKARVAALHAQGLATLTYVQEKICATYGPAFEAARERDALVRTASGQPYVYPAYLGEETPPSRPMGLIDFTAPRAQELYDLLLRDPLEDGHDGWMEDFGESFPPDGRTADGQSGATAHNTYPVGYHRAGQSFADRAPRPLARFTRSGWTGVHPYTPIVWGGDPTTSWGFDGLESSVKNALTMGLSGISTWGSDIGGFFSLGTNRLTPELLIRWIQFGAVSTVMRTKAGGVAVPQKERPQIWEREVLPHWKRWARLHTRLQPYLAGATARYRETGMPVMAHLALVEPGDAAAAAREDEFLFGPDLLAAPVLRPGATERELYLPRGRWVDVWRSVRHDDGGGALALGAPRVLDGGREVTVPAPLDELPLLARAGTILPLLWPDVDTLADYGAGAKGVVRLADRRDRLDLLAFPRGSSRARFNDSETLVSRERRLSRRSPRAWTLAVRGERTRLYRLQASLGTLTRPFRPCRVRLGKRRLPASAWRYDRRTKRLRVTFRTKRGTLTAEAAGCRRGSARGR
jgi:sulfoquinovosidase